MDHLLSRISLIIIPIVVFMALGAWFRHRRILTDEAKGFINKFIYNFSLPALVFLGICGQDKSSLFDLKTVLPSVLALLTIILLVFINAKLFRFERELRGILISGALWGNVGYLGLPVIQAAYGQEGLEVAVVINAFLSPLMLIFSSLILTHTSWKMFLGAFVNPPTLSAILGLTLVYFSDSLQSLQFLESAFFAWQKEMVFELCEITGRLGLPLGLLSVGASLNIQKGSMLKFRRMLVTESIAKLLVCPFLCWLFVGLIPGISEIQRNVSVILMAMPASVAFYALVREEEKTLLAASHLGMSTILCCISIPIWMAALM